MPDYEWVKAEWDYIYGYTDEKGKHSKPTHKGIGKRYNIPKGTVDSYATSHNWTEKRNAESSKIIQKASEEKTSYEASEIVKSNQKFGNTAENLRKLAAREIELNWKKLNNYERLIKDDPEHPDAWKYWVKAVELKNIAESLKDAQEIIKTAQGEITERIRIENNVNEDLIKDPDYIQAKAKAMNEYYVKRKEDKTST